MTAIPSDRARQYVERGGEHCPHCAGVQLTGDALDIDGRTAWCTVSCDSCGEKWRDVYQLVGVEPL